MTRFLLAIGVTAVLLGAPLVTRAADETAAPVSQGQPASAKDEGCMPGGGCCGGSTACPAAKRENGTVTGGCPCQKAKAAAAQKPSQGTP